MIPLTLASISIPARHVPNQQRKIQQQQQSMGMLSPLQQQQQSMQQQHQQQATMQQSMQHLQHQMSDNSSPGILDSNVNPMRSIGNNNNSGVIGSSNNAMSAMSGSNFQQQQADHQQMQQQQQRYSTTSSNNINSSINSNLSTSSGISSSSSSNNNNSSTSSSSSTTLPTFSTSMRGMNPLGNNLPSDGTLPPIDKVVLQQQQRQQVDNAVGSDRQLHDLVIETLLEVKELFILLMIYVYMSLNIRAVKTSHIKLVY